MKCSNGGEFTALPTPLINIFSTDKKLFNWIQSLIIIDLGTNLVYVEEFLTSQLIVIIKFLQPMTCT